MSKYSSYIDASCFLPLFQRERESKVKMIQTQIHTHFFHYFKRFKTECQSLLMIYAKKDKEGTSNNTGNASNAPLYQRAACYFLALLSFLRMKGNSKKDPQHAREGKVRRGWGLGGWGGKRVQQEIDFIVCGRWMMAQHKNPTKASRWSLCDSKAPKRPLKVFFFSLFP